MATKVRVEGLKELEHALKELPKATGKNVLKRALIKAAEPIERAMEAKAPQLTGWLKASVTAGTKLSSRQAQEHRAAIGSAAMITVGGYRSNPSTGVYVFVGPGPSARSIVQEFGSINQAPQPYARPAWDEHGMSALDTIRDDLAAEIEKARARLARKAERDAAKMKV